jgi:hypothetical protein
VIRVKKSLLYIVITALILGLILGYFAYKGGKFASNRAEVDQDTMTQQGSTQQEDSMQKNETMMDDSTKDDLMKEEDSTPGGAMEENDKMMEGQTQAPTL